MIKNRIFAEHKRWFNGICLAFPHTSGGDPNDLSLHKWGCFQNAQIGYIFLTQVGVLPLVTYPARPADNLPHSSGGDPFLMLKKSISVRSKSRQLLTNKTIQLKFWLFSFPYTRGSNPWQFYIVMVLYNRIKWEQSDWKQDLGWTETLI